MSTTVVLITTLKDTIKETQPDKQEQICKLMSFIQITIEDCDFVNVIFLLLSF
mgnify:FL=1